MRNHPAVAREYESLKRHLAGRHNAGEIASYPDAKTDFIEGIVQAALQSGYPTDV